MAMMPSPSRSSKLVPPSTKLNLPAGFRFHPTDEELIVHYLMNQAASIPIPCPVPIIAEVNIYQCNPWDLPGKALFGESEWYFFSPRDRKYPNGARPNRAAGSGYWKATGTDKAIICSPTGKHVGVKKALVFYGGRPPRGVKTDWIMHEYRLVDSDGSKTATRRRGSSMRLDDWVLCRIHKKSNDFQFHQLMSSSDHQEASSTVVDDEESPKTEPDLDQHEHDDLFQSFPHPQTTATTTTSMAISKSYSLTDLLNSIDCSALSQFLDGPTDGEGLDLPQLQSPALIYPTPTQTHQALNYNNNNNNNLNINYNNQLNMPPVHTNVGVAASSDSVVLNNSNCNNGVNNKRKRIMMPSAMDDGRSSLDDGTDGFSRKPKVMLPSDSSTNNSSSSSYCNHQVVDTSGLFHQYSSLLNYPFLEMQ